MAQSFQTFRGGMAADREPRNQPGPARMRTFPMTLTGRPCFGCGRPGFPPPPPTPATSFWLGKSLLQSLRVNTTAGQSTLQQSGGGGWRVGGAFCQIDRLKVSLWVPHLGNLGGGWLTRGASFPDSSQRRCTASFNRNACWCTGAEQLKVAGLVRSKPACLLL